MLDIGARGGTSAISQTSQPSSSGAIPKNTKGSANVPNNTKKEADPVSLSCDSLKGQIDLLGAAKSTICLKEMLEVLFRHLSEINIQNEE